MSKLKIIIITITLIILIAIFAFVIKQNTMSNEYQIEEIGKYKYFKLYENQKYGVIDEDGNIIIPAIYTALNIPNPTKGVFICYSSNNQNDTKVFNEKNEEILTGFEQVLPIICVEPTSNIPFEKSVLIYKEHDRYGILDYGGNKITNAIYDEIKSLDYREGCLLVRKDDKYGVLNIKGQEVIKCEYNNVKSDKFYSNSNKYMKAGFILEVKTEEGYRYGYANENGREVLKIEFNSIDRITEVDQEEAYLMVSKNGKKGVLKNNRNLLDIVYEEIEYNSANKLFIVKKSGKQGLYSLVDGKEVLPLEYDSILCSNNKITARKGDSIDTYSVSGEKLDIKSDNNIATANEEFTITIDSNNKYGLIGKKGQTLVKNEYENLEYAFDNFFIASKNGKVGVINSNGETKAEFKYDIIQKVKEKNILQAIISSTNTIEMYNDKMEKQISQKNTILYSYENYIKLISDTDMQYLDNNGNIISNKDLFKENELFSYKYDGKWGFVDKNNNVVVEIKYDLVTEFTQYGFAGIKKNNKWGVVDKTGKVIVEPTYEINWNEPEFISKYFKSNFGYGFEYYTVDITK